MSISVSPSSQGRRGKTAGNLLRNLIITTCIWRQAFFPCKILWCSTKYQKQSFSPSIFFVRFDCDESWRHIRYLSTKPPITIAFNNMGRISPHICMHSVHYIRIEKGHISSYVFRLLSMAIFLSLSLSRYLICCYCICCRCCCCCFSHCCYSINKCCDKSVEWVSVHTSTYNIHKPSHGAFVIEFCARCCSSTHHDTCERAKKVEKAQY